MLPHTAPFPRSTHMVLADMGYECEASVDECPEDGAILA